MRNELELVVIGDDSVRNRVYHSLSRSVEQRKNQTQGVQFPSFNRNNDSAIALYNATYSEFTLHGKKIRYGIHEYTNHSNALTSETTSSYLLKKNLTVVVCIDTNRSNFEFERFDAKINTLQAIRKDQPFNIIPMLIRAGNSSSPSRTIYSSFANMNYPERRNTMSIDSNVLDNPEYTQHLSIVLDVSLTTPFYTEVQNCLKQLTVLNENVANIPSAWFLRKTLFPFLQKSLEIVGDDDRKTQDILKTHFERHRKDIQDAFTGLRANLATSNNYRHTYYSAIVLNILCAMAAIIVCLTLIGAFFVAPALERNMRYHNNYFKFFATNDQDEKSAMVATLEDHIIRTDNMLQR